MIAGILGVGGRSFHQRAAWVICCIHIRDVILRNEFRVGMYGGHGAKPLTAYVANNIYEARKGIFIKLIHDVPREKREKKHTAF